MSIVVQDGTDGEIGDLGRPAGGGPAGHEQTQPEPSQRHNCKWNNKGLETNQQFEMML